MSSRRIFIKKSVLAGAGTWLVPQFLGGHSNAFNNNSHDNKLVVIQLSGGNDGLNTVIPYQNDIYYNSRPQIGIPKKEVLQLTDNGGLHPVMKHFEALFKAGDICIVNNVGYPNAERSHFRSMDIWHTASNANEYWQTGWLGRWLDSNCNSSNKSGSLLELDDSLSLAVKGEHIKGLACSNIEKLQKMTAFPFYKQIANQSLQGSPELQYMYKTMLETYQSAEYLQTQISKSVSKGSYPMNKFGQSLKTIGNLISSGIDTTVFYTSLSGFDTHANQQMRQSKLLETLDAGVGALIGDLKSQNRWQNTTILIFSEFGRRVKENGSKGTDHGAANQAFICSGKLKKAGFYSALPSLLELEDGDIAQEIDFRQIYANILQDWLFCDHSAILQKSFTPTIIL